MIKSPVLPAPKFPRPASVVAGAAWPGSEAERLLDQEGMAQAGSLAQLLSLLRPGRLISAPALRCRQTLADLARALAIEVEVDARFDGAADAAGAATALQRLAGNTTTVVCSEEPLIPAAVARLSGRPEREHAIAMGDALVLSFSRARLVAADALGTSAA